MATRLAISLVTVLSIGLVWGADAYDTESHRSLGEAAAARSRLDEVLREHLAFPAGQNTVFQSAFAKRQPASGAPVLKSINRSRHIRQEQIDAAGFNNTQFVIRHLVGTDYRHKKFLR